MSGQNMRQSRSALIGEIIVLQGDVERYRERCAIKDAEIARLRAALDEIARPINAIQERAKAEGLAVDGGMAVMLANDHNYLKQIATKAIKSNGDHEQVTDGQNDR